jgi:hypothetical protein
MNGLLDSNQTSDNTWSQPVHVMLHEHSQTGFSIDPLYQDSVFESLEQQMAQQESEFADAITKLKGEFIFTNAVPVQSFLQMHRGLASILLEAVAYLKDCFGPDTPLTLEIMSDESPVRVIYALALWKSDRAESRAALNRFDEIWWMNNLEKAGGRIVFDYELL